MRNITLLITILIGSLSAAWAQQDAQFSQYMFNQQYFNPAAVGSEGVIRFQLLNRMQWVGYQPTFDDGGSPLTQVVSFNMPISRLSSGIGLHIVNDRIGPLTNQEVQLSYAYRLKLGADATLAIGARGGIYAKTLDGGRFRPRDPGDPIIPTGRVNDSKPDFSVGLLYQSSSYYVGLSLNHLANTQYSFGFDQATNPLKRTAYLNAGYNYYLTELIELRPSVLVKSDLTKTAIDINVLAQYDGRIWVGLGNRFGDALIGMAGIYLLPSNALRVGAAFDLTTTGASAKSPWSNEILVSYALPAPKSTKKSIVRTPRFRY